MGYEITLVLTNIYSGDDGAHGTIATVDLSKPGDVVLEAIRAGRTDPNWFYYADDGDTHVTRDKYDEPIRAVDPEALISAMAREGADYRRYRMAIPLLRAAVAGFGDDLRVFAFGH